MPLSGYLACHLQDINRTEEITLTICKISLADPEDQDGSSYSEAIYIVEYNFINVKK